MTSNITIHNLKCSNITMEDSMGNSIELFNSIKILQKKIDDQDKEIQNLKMNITDIREKFDELYYSPGMPGYEEALNSFNSLK